MSNDKDTAKPSTPWHFWVVGIVAVLWSAMGALDYVMTQTRNEAYLSSVPAEQLAFFYALPTWTIATWAIAVWGGVLGGLLLLFKRRQAIAVFLVSLLALLLSNIQMYGLSNGMEIMGDAFNLAFTAIIFVLSLAFFLYSRAMRSLLS